MQWSELFNSEYEPTESEIKKFVSTPLWDDLTGYIRQTYNVQPKLFYSRCSMDNGFWLGWNIKYKKGGKALCTLYPKQGYFMALIAIGEKEKAGADFLMPLCDKYTQNLYGTTKSGMLGKSLPIEVTNGSILQDVKNLIALRIK